MTQAQSNVLNNNVRNAQTFWTMRDIGRSQRAGERGLAPAAEEVAARPREETQSGLAASQIDPLTGALIWPGLLQQARFSARRKAIDQYAAKWEQSGGLDFADRQQMRKNINEMLDTLKSEIGDVPPHEYLTLRLFLQGLLQATTRNAT